MVPYQHINMGDFITLGILGIVQGLTEFLPVSSTGHLILAREFFGFGTSGFGLAEDAVLHLATALAVFVYFRSDIVQLVHGFFRAVSQRAWNRDMTLLSALALGTVPAVVLGLWFERAIETTFRSSVVVAGALIAGSIIFVVAEWVAKRVPAHAEVSMRKGLIIGLFQALALIPGMSRSGMTISGGMLLGLSRVEAARFAFLLSFPVILGAGGLKLYEMVSSGAATETAAPLVLGAFTAFMAGMLAIHVLITLLKTRTLMPFVVYRLALAGVILLTLL